MEAIEKKVYSYFSVLKHDLVDISTGNHFSSSFSYLSCVLPILIIFYKEKNKKKVKNIWNDWNMIPKRSNFDFEIAVMQLFVTLISLQNEKNQSSYEKSPYIVKAFSHFKIAIW